VLDGIPAAAPRDEGLIMSVDFSIPADPNAELAALRARVADLEQSLYRYEQLIQSARDAFVLLDQDLRVQIWNRMAETLYGIPAERALGARSRDVFHAIREAGGRSREELRDLVVEQGFWQGEACITRVDGGEVVVETTAYRIDRHDHFDGMVIIHRDIAPRLRAELELRERTERQHAAVHRRASLAEARYRTLIKHLPMAIYMADLDDLNSTIYVSPQIEQLFGYTPEEWCADPTFWMSRVHPDDYQRILADQYRFKATLMPHAMEFRLLHKDGRVVWVRDEPTIVYDDNGQPLFLLGFTQDITAHKQAEAAHDRLAAIVAASDDAITATDLNGVVLSWNAGAERMYGYAANEMIGHSIERIVPADRMDEVRMIADSLRRGQPVKQLETVRLQKQGTTVVTSLTGSPIYDDTGQVVSAAFIARDISARTRAEEAQRFLAEAGALLAASLDYEATLGQITHLVVPRLADGCSVYITGNDGKVRQVADAHLTPKTDAIARELDQHYPADPDASDALASIMRQGTTMHVPEISDSHLVAIARDARHLALMRAQGLQGFVAVPLLARGRVLGVITFNAETPNRHFDADDIALAEELARRAALAIENARLYQDTQHALRRHEETLAQLDSLLDHTPIGLGFVDAQLRFVRANNALAAVNGQPARAHIGRPLREISPLAAALAEPLMEQVLATGQPILGYELNADSAATPGLRRTFLLNYYPIALHDHPIWGVGMALMEITERRQAEEAHRALERKLLETQKLESLGVMAGGIAHDFNNLLVAILGNAELALLDLPPDSPARDSIQQVQIASRRAAELTGQMLAYSGRGRFIVEPVWLNMLIAEMTTLLHASIPKRVHLHTNLAPELPLIEADATQIRQVIMNLVINASEAIESAATNSDPGADGEVTVTTWLCQTDSAYLATTYPSPDLPPGKYVALEVADTGAGMDQATLDRIFEPFFTTKFTGRGLGLAAVLGIVRGHRGTLKINSTLGQGTTITVLLPAIQQLSAHDQAMPLEENGQETLSSPPSSSALHPQVSTVLVIDDEPSVRNVARRMLERLGYQLLFAEEGVAGLEQYREHAAMIAAVLLDLTMPRMSGEEVYQELRRLDPGARVVVMSGYSAEEMRARFPASARIAFLQKPFTPEALGEALRAVTRARP
jgi:PAS domain S-box-containing protein